MKTAPATTGPGPSDSLLFQRALVGGGVWLLTPLAGWNFRCLPVWPESLTAAILLFSPLVLVPLGLGLSMRRVTPNRPSPLWRLAAAAQLPAALLLVLAFACPSGIAAAGLTIPWLTFAVVVALLGMHGIKTRGLLPLPETCADMGFIFLPVGAGWAMLARAGIRPLDFEPMMVLLTAAHFHFAGFVLPLLTGWAGQELNDRISNWAAVGVVAGVPLVAAGITLNQLGSPWLEWLASWLLSGSCVLVAILHLRLVRRTGANAARFLFLISGLSLVAGMSFAALYGVRNYLALPWLDIPTMILCHATTNAFGFCLAGLWAWKRQGAEV